MAEYAALRDLKRLERRIDDLVARIGALEIDDDKDDPPITISGDGP